jgi:Aromatic acid exporter family member 2
VSFQCPFVFLANQCHQKNNRIFCVGVSTAFAIINTLDRLMVAAKELVGEHYHIHGIGVSVRSTGVDMGPRTRTASFKKGEV